MEQKITQTQIEHVVEVPNELEKPKPNNIITTNKRLTRSTTILTRSHAGYFRISLSLSSQALLWKILLEQNDDVHSLQRVLFHMVPSSSRVFIILLWSLALFTLLSQSLLYLLRCFLHFEIVKAEFLHHVGVNYLFAPWISWLLLLQSSPFIKPNENLYYYYYLVFWWVLVIPIVILDIKIYGQWFTTKGKRFLSTVANPSSQLSVIGNLVAARAAAQMGWIECGLCMFSLGMAHYLVLFVTLYQRFCGDNALPVMLKPVFFLFIGAPSMGSLAWASICGKFDYTSKMLFFLSLFLFMSLVSRPTLFKKSMRKFNVAWWAYSFPLTLLALAATEYGEEVKSGISDALMLVLLVLSSLMSNGDQSSSVVICEDSGLPTNLTNQRS
ncbi:hypothetical protein CsatA_016714 [Cannabis sativa]